MKNRLLIWIIILMYIVGCQKEDIQTRSFARVATGKCEILNGQGVILHGEVIVYGDHNISDHGFIYGENENKLELGLSDYYALGKMDNTGNFDATIKTCIDVGTTYFYRCYTVSDGYIVYGNIKTFDGAGSSQPVISGFGPEIGVIGDSVFIYGENFAFHDPSNHVFFNQSESKILSSTDTLLIAEVPKDVTNLHLRISLQLKDYEVIAQERFQVLLPSINRVVQDSATFGDTIQIVGENFSPVPDYNTVSFSKSDDDDLFIASEVVKSCHDTLIIVVPNQLDYPNYDIIIKTIEDTYSRSSNRLYLKPPEIFSLSVSQIKSREGLIVFGKNFNPIAEYNNVQLNGLKFDIDESSNTHLAVSMSSISLQTEGVVQVTTAGQTCFSDDAVQLISPWVPVGSYEDLAIDGAAITGLGNKLYICSGIDGSGFSNKFYEFDVTSKKVNQLADFPGNPIVGGVAFSHDNKIYVTLGVEEWGTPIQSQLWIYDIETNNWSAGEDTPMESRKDAIVFGYGNYIYMGGGRVSSKYCDDLWRYNLSTHNWNMISTAPLMGFDYCFTIDNIAYIGNSSKLFAYDLSLNEWEKKTPHPEIVNQRTAFNSDETGFVGNGQNNEYSNELFYRYNDKTDTWSAIQNFGVVGRFNAFAIPLVDKVYVGMGEANDTIYNDIWYFDPDNL